MNVSTSECSSGCESGWTMYLDQSSNSEDQFHTSGYGFVDRDHRSKVKEEDDDKDEDLSMVSDASSGPLHFHEDEDRCFNGNGHFCYASQKAKKREKKKKSKGNQQHSYLDDTASSPVRMSYSKKNIALSSNESSMEHGLGFSHGFSTTHLKGKSAFRNHFGSLKSSVPGKPDS